MKRENKSEVVMLRQKAEVLLKTKTSKSRKQLSEAEMQRLIHELEVHQIELEMQNDELVRAKEQTELYFQKYIVLKECVPTKESLVASEARYRRLFESSKDGILILDAETGVILDVNPFLIEMLGYSEDQFLEKAIWKIGFFNDIFANHENFLELKQKDYVRYDDLPLETADGSKINVEFVGNIYLLENREVIQFNIRDISDRKRSEVTLLKLSSAIEQTVDSIMITDRNGTIEYVNHAFETLTGYSFDEAVGKTPRILKSGIYEQKYYERLWNTILTGRVFKEDIVNKKKNGDLYEEEETISPIFDKNKIITHFVGSGVNISKRKIAEKELIEAKEHAEESDRLKSAFLANMSHEIRSPLNSIIGFSDLLADPDYDGNQKSEFLRHIIASGNNLLTIISDIMDISKLESGEIPIHNSQINARGFIENVEGKFSFLTEKNNVELRLTLPDKEEETIIFADTERLFQIFNNLISNAFKFTVKGQIEIGYQPKGKMAEFFVKDSGIGIPTEYHTKIFDRFRQVENPFTRKFGGNGLGLAISKKLVELMGGKIWVVSDSGVGSVFYFTVPIFQCVNHATNS